MHTYVIQKATTNVSIELEIVDDTDGTPETGVLWNTAGIDLAYRRDGAVSTAIVEATLAALTTAHTDGGFLHIGDGVYRFDLPDLACATGVDKVVIHGTVTGMVVIPCVIQLVAYDPFDAVRMGMTALPNASADAAGGLIISDAGGLDADTILDVAISTRNSTTPPTAAAIVNEWETQSQADPTGFHVNLKEADSQAVTAAAAVTIHTDVGMSATAQGNIEDQYDTTGITGGNFPATQDAVSNIGSASGGAIVIEADSDNSAGALNGVTLVGTVTSGTYASTEADDGVYLNLTGTATAMDYVLGYSIGGNRQSVALRLAVYLNGGNDSVSIQMYDFVGTTWVTRYTLNGQSGDTNINETKSLVSKYTGTGANIGKVYVRFVTTGQTNPDLFIDECVIEAVSTTQSVGYTQGRIWVDTADGTAGTESYVNGVADNKVLTFADALTIGSNVGIHEYNMSPDSTLTLAANISDAVIYGVGYTLNFGGFDCSGTHFYHASPINGVVLSATSHVDILDSIIQAVTVNDAHFTNCSFTANTVTFGAVASDIKVIDCRSVVAGSGTPKFDFGISAGIDHNLTIADWQNGLEIANFNANVTTADLCSISGTGQLIIAASCTGGTINLRGQWKVTDNASGAVALVYDDVASNVIDILTDTADMQPKLGAPAADLAADIAAVLANHPTNFSVLNIASDGDINGNVNGNIGGTVAGNVTGTVGGIAGTIQTLDALDTAQDAQHASTRAVVDDLAIKKNTSGLLHIEMVLTSDHITPAPGLTVTAQRLIDNGTYASVSGAMTEVSNGTYRFDYLAADCNGTTVTWRFSSGTADDTKVTFRTVV